MNTWSRLLAAILLFGSFASAPVTLYGAEVLHSGARHRQGIVDVIDFADRTAIISGYKYSFGEPGANYYPDVTMLNSDFGSFELLKPGMKVDIVYGEFGFIRVVVSLQQLPDDAVIKLI